MALTRNSLYASFISLGIIVLLVIAGPANAINLNLNSDKQSVVQGEDVSFNLKLDLTPYNEANIKHMKLSLDGPLTRNCLFDVNGDKISACLGIKSITKLSTNSTYGYGYGYGYGANNLEYQIVLNTDDLPSGDYNVSVKVILKDNSEGDSNSKSLKVNSKPSASENSGGGKKKVIKEEEKNNKFNPLSNSENPNTDNNNLDLSGLENKDNGNNPNNPNGIVNFFKNLFKNILIKLYNLF